MTVELADRPARSFAFGPFVLVPERQLLLKRDVPVHIGGRALDMLTALVERAGELISKGELLARVWPDTFVEAGNLKVNMTALRRALGEESGSTQYIATVVGRGYRFVAPVRCLDHVGPALATDTPLRHRHNLPLGTTRIFGRAEAIEAIRADLEAARLVSVVGSGGIGKTTVALAVAERAVGRFADGVWLVDMGLQRDPTWVPNAIATAIGAVVSSADPLVDVIDFLRGRETLLVFDSCEHILHGVALSVDRILANTSRVTILATTREPLRLREERVRRLAGLIAPPTASRPSAAEALTFPAVQLFVDRAASSFESFTLEDEDGPVVAELCRRLDGLALAIEIAATRVEAFGVGGLLKQLDDRFRLLVGRRAGPERHRTLLATLDWSYGLLASEGPLLRAVSVFAGTFDVDDAAAVADVSAAEAADALTQLVAKSLVTADLDAAGLAYRLLETTRTYCLGRLETSDEDAPVRTRHAEHVCTVLEGAESERAESPGQWAAAYGRVLDDLRAALAWTSRDPTHRSLRIRLTLAGLQLWNELSLTEECRLHVSRAVGELDAAGLTGTAYEMKLKVWHGGATMFTRGLRSESIDAMRRALAIAVQLGDSDYHLRCLRMIGIYELFTGEHEAGLQTLEAFARCAAASDPPTIPESHTHIGIAELFLGRLTSGRQRLERLQRQQDKGPYSVRYLSDRNVDTDCALSQIQWLAGAPDTATRTALRAVERARTTEHHLSLNNALSYACPVFYWSGHYETCDHHVALLAAHVLRHGIFTRRPVAMFYRAALRGARGDTSSERADDLRHAIEEFRSINHLARMPYYLSVLADATAAHGDIAGADRTIREALDLAHATKEAWCVPELLRVHASIRAAESRFDDAESLLLEAMTRAAEIGAASWRLRTANDLATLWSTRSRREDAHALLRPIYDGFDEGAETRDLTVARELLASLTPADHSEIREDQ